MPHAPDASTNVVKRDYSIVVFINIDWKASRHETEKADKRNMDISLMQETHINNDPQELYVCVKVCVGLRLGVPALVPVPVPAPV